MSQAILPKTTQLLGCLKPFGSRENPACLSHELLLKTSAAQKAQNVSQILKAFKIEQQSTRKACRILSPVAAIKTLLETMQHRPHKVLQKACGFLF